MEKSTKKVYLDTSIWIDLERSQSEINSPHRKILDHVLSQVEKGLLCLPLSLTHCMEMLKHEDAEKRRNLWLFATSISGGCALINKQDILQQLIQEAVCKVFGSKFDGEPIEVFTISGLFGIEFDRQSALTKKLMTTEYGWNHF